MSTDKKLSDLSSLSRTELEGTDLFLILDQSETVLGQRDKSIQLEELYQYVSDRFSAGGDTLYLLKGVNATQEGYFKSVYLNTLGGNTDESGGLITIADGTIIRSTAAIQASYFYDHIAQNTGIDLETNNTIVFRTNGLEKARIDSNGLLSFSGDFDTGIRLSDTNELSVRASGVDVVVIDPTSISVNGWIKLTAGGGYILTLGRETLSTDRTITFPDADGIVVTTGDTGTITSAMIANNTIIDEDINATAAIAVSKLANGTARQLLQTNSAGNGVEWSTDIDIPGTLDVTSTATFDGTVYIASSGTIAGDLNLGSSIIFEGSTVNDFETTLSVVDPTADRVILLPNVSGTLVSTGDTGTVTSTMIANNTIVDADISSSAAIVDTKLNTIATANKVSITSIDLDGGTDIGADLADADLFLVDDGATGTNRKAASTRISTYVFSKISGDVTINSSGTAAIGSGVITNTDINASAEIDVSKLANGTTYQLIQTDAAGTGVEWTSSILPESITMTGTGALKLAAGTGLQRPSPPADGMIRYNSDIGCVEGYIQSQWVVMANKDLDYGLITTAVTSDFDYGDLT